MSPGLLPLRGGAPGSTRRGSRFACAALLAGALGCAGCGGAPSGGAPRASLDPTDSIEVVLARWYDAIAAHDSLGIEAPLLPEFFILEDTRFVPRAELVRGLLAGAGMGHQTSERSEFRTVVTDSVAWTTFRNRERWLPAQGAPDSLEFLESVVFRKRDGRWRMERYHATRVQPSEPR